MSRTFNMVGGGGGKAVLAVTVTNGTATSVTATKSGVSVSLTYSGGIWSAELPSFGIWTVSATDGTRSQTDTVNASVAGLYTLTLRLQDIPNAYTQLEYIESTGAQSINTGVYVNPSYYVSITSALTGHTGSFETLFGTLNDSAARFTARWNKSTEGTGTFYQRSVSVTATASSFAGYYTRAQSVDVYHTFAINNRYALADSTTVGTFNAATSSASFPNPLIMFAIKGTGPSYYDFAYIKSTGAFIKNENGVYVRNFIPAKRNSDAAVGFFDAINSVFYASATSTPFVAGPAV